MQRHRRRPVRGLLAALSGLLLASGLMAGCGQSQQPAQQTTVTTGQYWLGATCCIEQVR